MTEPALGLLNCLRGRDLLPRWVFFLVALLTHSAVYGLTVGAIVTAGLALWLSTGWSNGLIAVTGTDTRDPTECPWLYRLTCQIIPDATTNESLRRWGALFMCGRGAFLLPLFAGLAWHSGSYLPLLFGFGCLAQGVIYYGCGKLCQERYAVLVAEPVFGWILGWLISASIT